MNDILIILLCILSGMLFGVFLRAQRGFLLFADKAALAAVYALLCVLGAGIGGNPSLFARLPSLGGAALCIAVCSCLGSVLCVRLAEPFLPRAEGETRRGGSGSLGSSSLWGTARILLFFLSGLVLARAGWFPAQLMGHGVASYLLWILVFAVGIGLGGELKAFGVLREMHVKIVCVPLCIIAGTALGACAAGALLPEFSPREALAVGAGFGYYSLSSLIIEQYGDSPLAAAALLSNILRELLGILAAPLLARFAGKLAPVAVAGATAMDTCLPVIARFSGERYAIIAVFSGMTLTLLVPFLVAAVMQW